MEPSILVVLVALVAATVTDLWYREVPDWISWGATTAVVLLVFLDTVRSGLWMPFFGTLAGLLTAMGLGLVLYYTGQWGGGDGKLLIAIGAALGIALGEPWWNQQLLSYLLWTCAAAGLYGFAWFTGLAIRHWNRVRDTYATLASTPGIRGLRLAGYIVVLCSLGTIIAVREPVVIILATTVLGFALLLYLTLFVRAIERGVLIVPRHPDDLVEGDWIAKTVRIDDEVICGPEDRGIDVPTIERLQRFARERRIKSVLVKEGIPFVPALALGYCITVFLPPLWNFVL